MENLSYFYFAYGSNLNLGQMESRCPGAKFLKRGILPGYRFIIYSHGYASVTRDEEATVWGGIWQISNSHLVSLDRYEGISSNIYYREIIPVCPGDKTPKLMDCEIYFGADSMEGVPHPGYMEIVIQGARDCGLPEEYIANSLNPWV